MDRTLGNATRSAPERRRAPAGAPGRRAPAGAPGSSEGRSAAGDGRKDGELAARRDGGLHAIEVADVLAGQVDVDEAAQLAVLGDAAAKLLVLGEEVLEGRGDGVALDGDL